MHRLWRLSGKQSVKRLSDVANSKTPHLFQHRILGSHFVEERQARGCRGAEVVVDVVDVEDEQPFPGSCISTIILMADAVPYSIPPVAAFVLID